MFVDASAIVAILTSEPEAAAMLNAIESSAVCATSPLAVYEAVLAIHRKQFGFIEAQEDVAAFLRATHMDVVPITEDHGRLALEAHARFGKGRGHPARLNMGDCFSYAVAKSLGYALLFKGDDFIHTDIPQALR